MSKTPCNLITAMQLQLKWVRFAYKKFRGRQMSTSAPPTSFPRKRESMLVSNLAVRNPFLTEPKIVVGVRPRAPTVSRPNIFIDRLKEKLFISFMGDMSELTVIWWGK